MSPAKTPVEPLYKITDVARLKLLGYGKSTIRKMLQAKPPKIRSINLRQPGDKQDRIRIPESAIQEYLAKNGKPSKASK